MGGSTGCSTRSTVANARLKLLLCRRVITHVMAMHVVAFAHNPSFGANFRSAMSTLWTELAQTLAANMALYIPAPRSTQAVITPGCSLRLIWWESRQKLISRKARADEPHLHWGTRTSSTTSVYIKRSSHIGRSARNDSLRIITQRSVHCAGTQTSNSSTQSHQTGKPYFRSPGNYVQGAVTLASVVNLRVHIR